jgi:hypothetical protein
MYTVSLLYTAHCTDTNCLYIQYVYSFITVHNLLYWYKLSLYAICLQFHYCTLLTVLIQIVFMFNMYTVSLLYTTYCTDTNCLYMQYVYSFITVHCSLYWYKLPLYSIRIQFHYCTQLSVLIQIVFIFNMYIVSLLYTTYCTDTNCLYIQYVYSFITLHCSLYWYKLSLHLICIIFHYCTLLTVLIQIVFIFNMYTVLLLYTTYCTDKNFSQFMYVYTVCCSFVFVFSFSLCYYKNYYFHNGVSVVSVVQWVRNVLTNRHYLTFTRISRSESMLSLKQPIILIPHLS